VFDRATKISPLIIFQFPNMQSFLGSISIAAKAQIKQQHFLSNQQLATDLGGKEGNRKY